MIGELISVDGGRLRVVPAPLDAGPGSAQAGAPFAGVTAPPGATVVLLHGAGSGTDTPVLTALAGRLAGAGTRVATLEMPYRVAGRRAPDRPSRLDGVLTAAVAALGSPAFLGLAGASMGSRVAVRCARTVGARAVLALGFPLQPPGGRPSREPELADAGVPVLVIQGERDAFGTPAADPSRQVEVRIVAGADHSFRVRVRDARTVGEVAAEAADLGSSWLLGQLAGTAGVGATAGSGGSGGGGAAGGTAAEV
ncbi:hypothetical protein Ga0074812_12272 [Parafrankia irregularis]|uniref:KANL3/Tex30 alpha/beta hydrolase-like domain-containing protein n=1 Tax=Parafrankia irregularis TaxID=795642 RepID=A0A0S4QTH9_9ACTN|nr:MULTISPECIES: alpha/beta family hydrolase [Parafrankia]CUU58829.1 hypothetical protein Ga0074812_12272 [Parafrankia irregularis]